MYKINIAVSLDSPDINGAVVLFAISASHHVGSGCLWCNTAASGHYTDDLHFPGHGGGCLCVISRGDIDDVHCLGQGGCIKLGALRLQVVEAASKVGCGQDVDEEGAHDWETVKNIFRPADRKMGGD